MSILEVNNVSIRYMTGDFKDIGLKEYVVRRLKRNYSVEEFWADKNITFSLEKGDMLGIIGTNGAGKSTLLKAISGIMEPTKGYVKREGTIAALLELASGFDGDLTVKENTYLRGAMLGYTRKFMNDTYDQIIDFAELRECEHRPFKQLSSGMKSRLAFSIASLVNPDILILDEVLSVGDGAFRKKSEEKMKEIIHGGATTILVSHSIGQARELCNKVLWLHKGEQVEFGDDVQGICDRYEAFLENGCRHPATMDIFGCCVARDVFGFHPHQKRYKVRQFISWNSVVSAVSPPVSEVSGHVMTGDDCRNPQEFWKKVFLTDVNKTALPALKTSCADWLLLDMSDTGFGLVLVENQKDGTQTLLTDTSRLRENMPLLQEHGKLADCKMIPQSILSMEPEKVFDCVRTFIRQLCEIYRPEHIVLLEVNWIKEYMGEAGLVDFAYWKHWAKVNDLLEKCMSVAEEELPTSYVIRIPDGLYGDPKHKWGLGERHYSPEYYDYALKALNVITDESAADKQEELDRLHSEYSALFRKKREMLIETLQG